MYKYKILSIILLLSFIASPLFGGAVKVEAQQAQPVSNSSPQQVESSAPNDEFGSSNTTGQMRTTTMAMRIAAALNRNVSPSGTTATYAGINPDTKQLSPLANFGNKVAQMVESIGATDYFDVPNWANSALPTLDTLGNLVGGIKKFQDALPTFCPLGQNGLGQCIPVGIPDTTTFPGADYYEIAVVEYREQMNTSLPTTGTKLRGYVQIDPTGTMIPLNTANGLTMNILDSQGNQVFGVTKPHYLGPMIVATGCSQVANPTTCTPRPVRVKFTNYLPNGQGGDLFIPVDTTYMGAGMGPNGSILSINVTAGGSLYTSAPTVVIDPPPCTPGPTCVQAVATATVINGSVTAITINNGGLGYTAAPLVGFNGGGGSGAGVSVVMGGNANEMYTQNRATLHLHGGNTPWISDGTPHQWTTPSGELTSYSKGESVAYVPDMWFDAHGNINKTCAGQMTCTGYTNDPGPGSLTFFWTNQQSGRLLFFHDHSYGITRLNVYAGEAAGYLIVDPTEETTLKLAGVPGTITDPANLLTNTVNDLTHLVPLVIQDKTFVPDAGLTGGQLAATDPTWITTTWGSTGDLWFPHVYIPNQNPADVTGANAYGRWDYGPWFWPPQDPSSFVPSGQPYQCTSTAYPPGSPPAFPPLMCPGTPNPSGTPEGFMDTPVINGTLYPTLTVDPTSYRFQMLMAGNDRTWNLQLYVAEPLSIAMTNGGSGYTITPTVSLMNGTGGPATLAVQMSQGAVTSILLTNVGAGYTAAPSVTIDPPNCSPNPSTTCQTATAVALFDPITGTVSGVRITNQGAGYITAPLVSFTGASTTPAAAIATITPAGVVLGVKVTNYGTAPWTATPQVVFSAPGCTGCVTATAVASINSEVKMVPAVPHDPTSALPLCSQANPTSGAMLALALVDPLTGSPLNGTGLQANCWPTTWPHDGRDGGVPDPLTAGPPFIQIGSESGLLPAPVVIPSTPVNYNYNRRDITVLNVDVHGLLLGPAERADVLVDFSQFAGQTLLLYNDAPAPVPAFDTRTDYYTGDPDQTMAGGAPSTMPGYGPNTRTIMQIKVNPTGGPGSLNVAAVASAVSSAFNTRQNPIIVPEPTFQPGMNGYSATTTYARISDTSIPGFFNGQIGSIVLRSGGSGYTFAPNVYLQGGGGTGATAGITFQGANVNSLTLTSGGTGYVTPPTVTIAPPGAITGTQATASALLDYYVNSVTVTNQGAGYNTAPTVSFGGPGSGATATANLDQYVNAIAVTNGGSGYNTAPTVGFSGGGGNGAQATANITNVVNAVSLTGVYGGGSGYTSAPTVKFTGGGGLGAAATATISTVVDLVTVTNQGRNYSSPPTVVFTGGGINNGNPTVTATATAVLQGSHVISINVTNRGSGYITAPVVTLTGGGCTSGCAAATATITGAIVSVAITNGGSGYTSAPAVSFTGGGGSNAAATSTITGVVASITVTNGGTGYTSAPGVTFTPNGSGSGAAATATLSGRVQSVTVTNGGTGFTSAPVSVSFTPVNGGSGAAASASTTGKVSSLLITNAGSGYTSNPLVSFTGGGCVIPTCATATATYLPGTVASIFLTNLGTGYTSAPTVVFSTMYPPTSAASAYILPPLVPFGAKAIQELFTLDYGRMNATLGVELPFTNFFVQTTIPYGFIDPPTEMFQSGDTIFWKITHNGVDTHFIHFHLYDLQVINRVGWDGMIKPPDANEMAWKDTVRMNPLEDIIVAMRPMKQNLPWNIPNSMRPMDVTESIGAVTPTNTAGFANIDPANNPVTVKNDVINFGWEYVVHCHILGHEENDMMRSQLLAIPPDPPTNVNATVSGSLDSQIVTVTWNDGSYNETGFTVQRATNLNGPWLSLTPSAPPSPVIGTPMTYIDSGMPRFITFYYRVVANNVVGYTQTYAAPAVGYPTLSADSTPVNAPLSITIQSDGEPGPVFADSFETGLNQWSGFVGNVDVSSQAVIGPYGGSLGMVANIGAEGQPAYVYDFSPAGVGMYDASFYFSPNSAVTDGPVDIFLGVDQNGQPTFGVQYQFIDANTYQLRAWVLNDGNPEYLGWDVFTTQPGEDDPVNMIHKINIAWLSAEIGGLSFYVDDHLFNSIDANTSASQLEEVILGPSLGLSAGDSGSMYFDEFTSSRVNGLSFMLLLPAILR